MDAKTKVKTKAVTITELLIGAIFLMFASAAALFSSQTLSLTPRPDLTIIKDSFTYSDGLNFIIKNNGTASVSSFGLQCRWLDTSGVVIEIVGCNVVYSADLAAGASVSYPATFSGITSYVSSPPPGAVSLRLSLDPTNSIVELNERNNIVALPRPLPDLTVTDASWTLAGGLSFIVRNIGIAPVVPAPFNCRWLDSAGAIIEMVGCDIAYAPGLLPGESAAYPEFFSSVTSYINSPPPGAVSLRISADPASSFFESNENNNELIISRP